MNIHDEQKEAYWHGFDILSVHHEVERPEYCRAQTDCISDEWTCLSIASVCRGVGDHANAACYGDCHPYDFFFHRGRPKHNIDQHYEQSMNIVESIGVSLNHVLRAIKESEGPNYLHEQSYKQEDIIRAWTSWWNERFALLCFPLIDRLNCCWNYQENYQYPVSPWVFKERVCRRNIIWNRTNAWTSDDSWQEDYCAHHGPKTSILASFEYRRFFGDLGLLDIRVIRFFRNLTVRAVAKVVIELLEVKERLTSASYYRSCY